MPVVLLDSALGTQLTFAGVDTRPPLWSARALLAAPEAVREIHLRDALAGADVLTACTFRTHERTLAREGLGARAAELTALAVTLAREAAARSGRAVRVAGSLAPLEDCYRPDLVPPDADLASEHALQARRLADAGVDLILVETMATARELVAAARAALATGLPVVASVVTDGAGRLLSGESIAEGVLPLLPVPAGRLALGVSCVPARRLGGDLARLAAAAPGVPLAAYGNTGLPLDERAGRFTEPISPDEYARLADAWVRLGAAYVGGCCGTSSGHTRALRERSRGWSSPAASGP